MTGMFTEWAQNCRILLVIDNSPVNLDIYGLKNVTLEILPLNTTSMMQELDMGIVKSLKHVHHYHKRLTKKHFLAYEAGTDFSFDLLRCLELLKLSWAIIVSQK